MNKIKTRLSKNCYNNEIKIKYTHETSRVSWVSPDFPINLHKSLHGDPLHFIVSQSVMKTVSEEDAQRQALAQLVGSWGGTWGLVENSYSCHNNKVDITF